MLWEPFFIDADVVVAGRHGVSQVNEQPNVFSTLVIDVYLILVVVDFGVVIHVLEAYDDVFQMEMFAVVAQ